MAFRELAAYLLARDSSSATGKVAKELVDDIFVPTPARVGLVNRRTVALKHVARNLHQSTSPQTYEQVSAGENVVTSVGITAPGSGAAYNGVGDCGR
jgi:hypothetical protein